MEEMGKILGEILLPRRAPGEAGCCKREANRKQMHTLPRWSVFRFSWSFFDIISPSRTEKQKRNERAIFSEEESSWRVESCSKLELVLIFLLSIRQQLERAEEEEKVNSKAKAKYQWQVIKVIKWPLPVEKRHASSILLFFHVEHRAQDHPRHKSGSATASACIASTLSLFNFVVLRLL